MFDRKCESNHFIVFDGSKIVLVRFNGIAKLSDTTYPIVPVKVVDLISSSSVREDNRKECHCIKWVSSDIQPGTFVISITGKTSVWQLDDNTSQLTHIQTIEIDQKLDYDEVAVYERYIIACHVGSTILHLLNRKTGI